MCTSTFIRSSMGLLSDIFLQNFDRVMALDRRKNFVFAQYLENKLTESDSFVCTSTLTRFSMGLLPAIFRKSGRVMALD